jgi:hypothetical protein
MGRVRQAPIAVNGSGGAFTAITAATFARAAWIQEDGLAANRQGLTIKWPNGNTTDYAPGDEPILMAGNLNGELGGGHQPLVGVPAGFNGTNANAPATQYCQVKSLTATATTVQVTEDN